VKHAFVCHKTKRVVKQTMVEKMHFGSNNPARYCHHFASVIVGVFI